MTEAPENERPIEEAEEENALFVVDSETYQQNKQLKQIYKAKEEYAKLHREGEGAKQAVYWSKIKALIMELEPLMRQMETDVDYLNEYHLTTVNLATTQFEIQWSEQIDRLPDDKDSAIEFGVQENFIVKNYDVTGLSYLLDANGYLGYNTTRKTAVRENGEWKIAKHPSSPPRGANQTRVQALTGTKKDFDVRVFDKAYRACREFMSEAGLALKLEEDKGPARI